MFSARWDVQHYCRVICKTYLSHSSGLPLSRVTSRCCPFESCWHRPCLMTFLFRLLLDFGCPCQDAPVLALMNTGRPVEKSLPMSFLVRQLFITETLKTTFILWWQNLQNRTGARWRSRKVPYPWSFTRQSCFYGLPLMKKIARESLSSVWESKLKVASRMWLIGPPLSAESY